jgi:transcriptional regulator
MSIPDELGFLSADVAVVASHALEQIQRAENTLAVVDAGLSSVALVEALRETEKHDAAELDRLLLIFEMAAETRLKDLNQSRPG